MVTSEEKITPLTEELNLLILFCCSWLLWPLPRVFPKYVPFITTENCSIKTGFLACQFSSSPTRFLCLIKSKWVRFSLLESLWLVSLSVAQKRRQFTPKSACAKLHLYLVKYWENHLCPFYSPKRLPTNVCQVRLSSSNACAELCVRDIRGKFNTSRFSLCSETAS